MPKLILLVVLAAVLFISLQQLKTLPPEKRKSRIITIAIWAAIGLAILAVVTGKLHWLGAVIAASVGLIKALLPWLIQLWPTIKHHSQAPSDQDLELKKAYATLGLKKTAKRQDVIEAHRRLMLKMHPDKGGSHEQASQLNHAKKIILEYIDSQ